MHEDKPVARVNGRSIGRRMLRMVIAQAREQYAKTGKTLTTEIESEIEREAIDQLIGRELLFEESVRRNCHADESEIERQVDELAEQAGGMIALTMMLARRGMHIEEVRDGIRRDLAIDAVVDAAVVTAEPVLEEEARAFFEANRNAFKTSDRSTVCHISIGLPKNVWSGAIETAYLRLTKLRERVIGGESFDEVGRRASAEQDGIQSGLLGPVERGTLCAELETVAFSLNLNETSAIVRSPLGLHLLRVVAREDARELPYSEVLRAILGHLATRRRAELTDRLTAELRAQAIIEIL